MLPIYQTKWRNISNKSLINGKIFLDKPNNVCYNKNIEYVRRGGVIFLNKGLRGKSTYRPEKVRFALIDKTHVQILLNYCSVLSVYGSFFRLFALLGS